ncbi:MAG: DUF722 domain-containing protein [Clostridium sp.]
MLDKTLFRKTESILYRYNELIIEIRALELEIAGIEKDFLGCGAISYEYTGGPSNDFNSTVENEVISRDKMLKKLECDLYDKKVLKERIDSTIENLTNDERKLVSLRYINRDKLSWDQIAYVLKFSSDHCRKKMRVKVINKIGNTIFINPYRQIKMSF